MNIFIVNVTSYNYKCTIMRLSLSDKNENNVNSNDVKCIKTLNSAFRDKINN